MFDDFFRRFHRGSVAQGAIPIWPWLVAINSLHQNTFPRCKNCFMDLIAKFVVLFNILHLVSIVIPIHGVGFTEATKKTFSCTLRNCITVLAVLPVRSSFILVKAFNISMLKCIKMSVLEFTNSQTLKMNEKTKWHSYRNYTLKAIRKSLTEKYLPYRNYI